MEKRSGSMVKARSPVCMGAGQAQRVSNSPRERSQSRPFDLTFQSPMVSSALWSQADCCLERNMVVIIRLSGGGGNDTKVRLQWQKD